ncbi:MAG: penicillin-binding transpeptidase domain-containing protein [Bacilli bacterium]|nr:penicillin-binding transpeptidase domain-containing protein [Bacilli bacterium]
MKQKNNCVKLNEYFLIAIVLLFVLISIKIVYIAISPAVDGVDLKALALSNRAAHKKIVSSRGTIYDAKGEVLAQDVRSYTVIAYLSESRTTDKKNPHHVVDKHNTAKELSEILGMKVEYILKLLNQDLYQVELGPGGRGITELKKQAIEALDLPGIDFIQDAKRDYPNGDFASYIIGYARKNDKGFIEGEMGIESKYDDKLKGIDGKISYQKDAYGYKIAGTKEYVEDAISGYDIHLTIDSNIQMYLENAIKEFKKLNSKWGTITIADAKTGAIIASAGTPSFNPNILEIENYNNPLTSFSYEPGSTMKIFSFMAAIENNVYEGEKEYSSGNIMVDGYKISDWNTHGWGKVTYDTGFMYSSNVAAVKLAQKVGKDRLIDFYEKLGFGSKTNIELPNEYEGTLDMVYDSELASASYGQGITATPIQNIQALTSLTNEGITMKPFIISKIIDPNTGNVVYEGKKTELNKVANKETIKKVLDLMDTVVNGSDDKRTGKAYQTEALTLVGKTGTAQYTTESGKYSTGTYNNIRSFSGIFPKENPEYIIYLSVKDFVGSSTDLAKITKSVVESIAKYKNIDDRTNDIDKTKIVTIKSYINKKTLEASKELKKIGLEPVILGSGDTIVKQSLIKNAKTIVGTKIILVTNKRDYLMPDVKLWTRNEIINLANLIELSYTIDGFGNVLKVSIPPNNIIDNKSILKIELDNRSDKDEKEKQEKQEKQI